MNSIRPEKCHLGLTEAQYLGYQISQGLLKPQEKKVKAIGEFPWTKTKKQVCAFLGIIVGLCLTSPFSFPLV